MSANGQTIVVVEDDDELRQILVRGLGEHGFAVRAVASGGAALELAERGTPHAFIIDIGLPDSDGRDLCQALRAKGMQTPVLFLTARDAIVDRVAGFDAGGDDYLVKPFAFVELVARVQALLRRSGSHGELEGARLRLDPVTHSVAEGSAFARLTPTEYRVLARLLVRPGEAVRRADLVRAAWPHGAIVHDNTLDAYVARLRRKLRMIPSSAQIVTARGIGYRIE